jgi:hypothetical protein
MNLQLLFADDAVVVERFDDRLVGALGDLGIDFPFFLDDADRPLGIFFGVAQATIERSDDFLDFLRVLLDALIGRAVAVARELDDVADKRHFVVTLAPEHGDSRHRNDDCADGSGAERSHARPSAPI